MFFRVDNLIVLFGLIALAVPILLHFLQRRRFDTLEWGAMQFLPEGVSAQRRRWLDDLPLMLARMGLIALIVLALATPISTTGWLDGLTGRPTRDIVLVFDGSYSMDVRVPKQATPWEEAVREALNEVDGADSGDRFAVLIARAPPHWWHDGFVADHDEVRAKIRALPGPRGNADMPAALGEAWQRLLTRSNARTQEIRVFTDLQQHGWADPPTLAALDSLGAQWRSDVERLKRDGGAVPSVRLINVGAALPKKLPNYALAPLTASRGVAKVGQKLMMRSMLHAAGFDASIPPPKVSLAVDGKPVSDLEIPDKLEWKDGTIPLTYTHKFAKPGQYVVSMSIKADAGRDVLAADNEQHAVIDVVKELPILLVDGDRDVGPDSSTFFLQQALAGNEEKPISYTALRAAKLMGANKPAVVVLADVPILDADQAGALERFVANGGGLLIGAGERAARNHAFYNQQAWLPAKLTGVGKAKDGVQLESREFRHPALALFRDTDTARVRFTQWTRVQLAPEVHASASLTNGAPLLVEKPYKNGRVMLATVPLERSWGSTLPSEPEFPMLMHELVHYLAGISAPSRLLHNGAPIRLALEDGKPATVTLKTPERDGLKFDVKEWPWTFGNTGAIGVYQARGADGRAWSYVVRPDLAESSLKRCSDDDWRWVRARLPIVWLDESTPTSSAADTARTEIWWLLLILVLVFLCMEVWLTRRMALARGH